MVLYPYNVASGPYVTSRRSSRVLSDEHLRRYRELLRASDADAVHDLLVRHGPEILDRDLPYLVVAARHQLINSERRGASRFEIPLAEVPEQPTQEGSIWDPLASAIAMESTRELVRALAELDDRDVLVLWGRAANRSDEELAREWDRLGFTPSSPSTAAIRKRRERANVKVRQRLTARKATGL